MRRLILLRHAEAERAASTGRDIDRSLSDAGRAEARSIGRQLAEAGLKPDLALVSDAQRTRQTWAEAARTLGGGEVEFSPGLYNAGPMQMRAAVEAVEDRAEVVLVVGHNPGVPQLAFEYLVESAAPESVLDRFRHGFPTAGAVVFEVDAAGRPIYDGFLRPRVAGGDTGE